MIKIDRPTAIPSRLANKGAAATEAMKRQFDAGPQAYNTGTVKFEFDNDIYGHATVKLALRVAQHDKCCFCERKTEVGDVEHFRGKGGYQQDEQEKLQYPGYYWLAYTWVNLLFCCETCNRTYKRNYFPLENPASRALSHHDDLTLEQTLIINPSLEDPEQFIEFYGHLPRAINGNRKGLETIKRTGLDRPFIDDRRRNHYAILKSIFLAASNPGLPKNEKDQLLALVNEAAENNSEYASMIRCAIKHGFRF